MTTPINSTFISSTNPKNPFTERFLIQSPTRLKISRGALQSTVVIRTTPTVKCSTTSTDGGGSEKGETGGLKGLLSGMVDERVEELLNREENRVLLDELEKATLRVEVAKRDLAEIEKQEMEAKQLRAYVSGLESRAAEIAECQKEISEARAMVEEAERFLNVDSKNEERLESIKAASISALVGTLAELPICLSQVNNNTSQLILPLAVTFFSCALFGVTFRYAIRRDLDNFQLKSGTSAAFGFVKGLATLAGGPPLELDTGSLLSHAFSGALYVFENLLIFSFAAVGLDIFIKMGLLSPFPIQKSVSKAVNE